MRPEDDPFGFAIAATGKVPHLASLNVYDPCGKHPIIHRDYRKLDPDNEFLTSEEVEANGNFIAAAHNDNAEDVIDFLIGEVERLRKENVELKGT